MFWGLALDLYLTLLRIGLPVAMKVLPLPVIFQTITPRVRRVSAERAQISLLRAERVALHLKVSNTCLYRSMALFVGKRYAGEPVIFHMGILQDNPDSGHAWVELGGIPLDETIDPTLVTTFQYP